MYIDMAHNEMALDKLRNGVYNTDHNIWKFSGW